MDKFKLKSGKPIKIDGVGLIHQPLIMEIEEIGFDNYNLIIRPFLLPFEEFITEDLSNKIKNFDLFFILMQQPNEEMVQASIDNFNYLIQAFSFFFREDIQYDLENHLMIVGENGIIHKDNFDEIKNIILKINLIDISKRPKPKKLSPAQQKIHDKLAEHRLQHQDDKIDIEDIIDFVMYGGDGFIPYSVIETMTYCQLNTAFNIINIKNSWKEYLLYKTSEKFEVKEDMKNILANIKTYNKNIK